MKHVPLLAPDHPDAPKYWMHESSGVLAPAITNYLNGRKLEAVEIDRIKAYLWQWVKSPVWGPSGALEALRLRVAAISTAQDIARAVYAAVELGMDPL